MYRIPKGWRKLEIFLIRPPFREMQALQPKLVKKQELVSSNFDKI